MSETLDQELEEFANTAATKAVQNDKQLDLATRAITAIEKSEDRKDSVTPVDIVELSVAKFLQSAMDTAVESKRLKNALEDSLIEDLPKMNVSEKITLFNIERSSSNDRDFKLISPSIGMVTARQQAMIQAASKAEAQQAAVQVNVQAGGNAGDAATAASVSPEVSSGLNTIFQLLASRSAQLQAAKAEAVDVEAEASSEEN